MRVTALLWLIVFAAGLASVAAQLTVYSTNVVGYVNLTIRPSYNLLVNPLSAGFTNGANQIMNPIDGEQILTWNGTGFDFFLFDTGFGGWVGIDFNPAEAPSLPPGKGFFFFHPGRTPTNVTFVGEVVPAPCTTNYMLLPPGYSLVGSPLPAHANPIDSPPVSLPHIEGLQVLQWIGAGYDFNLYDSGFGGWIGGLTFLPTPPPRYRLGEGFFLYLPTTAAWSQTLDCP